MGMYTEVVVKIDFTREQIGSNNFDILDYMFNPQTTLITENYKPNSSIVIPDHEFFKCHRWDSIGNSNSFYHHPNRVNSWYFPDYEDGNSIYLFARNDLKNYDGEVEKFFDWLNTLPIMHKGDFIGYSLYEELDTPTIYNKET